MVVDRKLREEIRSFVDVEHGLVDRRIFHDPEIYRMELEQIFARAWLFMCHESQIPNPGDFFMNFMGEDRVIVLRDNDGGLQVLLNTCRHRGNAICRADEGHATSFMCTYHGWTYDLKGKLVGVPGYKDLYHEELERDKWGLIKAAQVDSYQGLVFATMDPEALPLYDYLGEGARFGIDLMMNKGDLVILPGVWKFTMNCNWKFPSDNTPDWYHGGPTHASALLTPWSQASSAVRRTRGGLPNVDGPFLTFLAEYGHGSTAPLPPENWQEAIPDNPAEGWRKQPDIIRRMGPYGARAGASMLNIFPNLWVPSGSRQVSIRMPKGPTQTQIWTFTLVDKNTFSEEYERNHVHRTKHQFGPAGMFEQEDGENWDQSTAGARGVIAGRYPLNYSMGLGHGEVIEDELGPPRIESRINEHAQLWTYRAWAEWMAAESWADLKANHSKPEGTL